MDTSSELPSNLKYAQSHEWLKNNTDDTATIGITEHAQEALGDVVFIELPTIGQQFSSSETFGVIESVKASSDLYMPVSGEIIAVNELLEQTPEIVNDSPYDKGWLIKIKLSNPSEIGQLLGAADYQKIIN